MGSVRRGDDRLLCSAWLHSLYLQQIQTLPKYPELRSERDCAVLTPVKAFCLKKSSVCCSLGPRAKIKKKKKSSQAQTQSALHSNTKLSHSAKKHKDGCGSSVKQTVKSPIRWPFSADSSSTMHHNKGISNTAQIKWYVFHYVMLNLYWFRQHSVMWNGC